jgi:hypothetical protein
MAQGGQTMMPMGGARKSRAMEKVEKPAALQPRGMTFLHARTIQFTLVSPVASCAPCQLVVSSGRVVMSTLFAIKAF